MNNVNKQMLMPAQQQAEPVGDGESIDFPIAFLTTESGGGKYKLVLSFASLTDLHKGHDRILSAIKHRQPSVQQQAEPVARDVQLPIAEKSFGAWDGLESIDELPDGTALYAQPPAVDVPDGYALVPIEPTAEMLDAAQREWLDCAGADPSYDIYMAVVNIAKKGST